MTLFFKLWGESAHFEEVFHYYLELGDRDGANTILIRFRDWISAQSNKEKIRAFKKLAELYRELGDEDEYRNYLEKSSIQE